MSQFPIGFKLDPIVNEIQYSQINQYSNKIHSIPLQTKCYDYFKLLKQSEFNFNVKLGDEFNHENVNMIKHLKSIVIYNNCFIENEIPPLIDEDSNLLEEEIYPFLSFKYPIFEHWDGEIYEISKPNKGESFLVNFKNHIKGDGIVISISDDFIDEVSQLIKNLRILGNELPIQLMYRNDLNKKNKQLILDLARGEINHLKNIKFEVSSNKFYSKTFPKQDIWFVNIHQSISTKYENEFQRYFQKELAYLFNTFENMILMDADVVLFKPPFELFKSKPFIKTGTLFFKDRNTNMRMSDRYVNFIKNSSPTPFDSILYDLKQSNLETNEYLNERYFHYQESGIVVVNRKIHLTSVLLTPYLSQFQSTFIASWGDKEHFFLGFLLNGDSLFEFNTHWAGVVGKEMEEEDFLNSPRLCSTHPAHFDQEDNSLIWMNSGFKTCPLPKDEYNIEDLSYWEERGIVSNMEEMIEMYSLPVDIKIGLIPIVESNVNEQLPICGLRVWCSYQNIAGKLGNVIQFSQDDISWFKYVINSMLSS